jgi:hypothetical protein
MAMSTMIGLTVAVGASPAGAAAPQRETFTYSDEFCYQDEGSSSSPTYCYRYTDTYTYKVIGTFEGRTTCSSPRTRRPTRSCRTASRLHEHEQGLFDVQGARRCRPGVEVHLSRKQHRQ